MDPDKEQDSSPEDDQLSLAVNRLELLNIINDAGLHPALMKFVATKKRLFTSLGVKGAGDLHSLSEKNVRTVIKNMSTKAFKVIEEWLLKICNKELEKYHSDDELLTVELQDQLTGYKLYHDQSYEQHQDASGKILEPTNLPTRAKLMIAALYSPTHRQLAEQIYQQKFARQRDDSERGTTVDLEWLHRVIFSPPSDELEIIKEETTNFSLFAAAAIAIRLRDFARAKSLMDLLEDRDHSFFPRDGRKFLVNELKKIEPTFLFKAERTVAAAAGEFSSVKGLEVLAQVNNLTEDEGRTKTGFSKIVALRREGTMEWKECSGQDLSELFPENGSIVHLVGPDYPPLPKYNSHAVWRVAEQNLSYEQQRKYKTNVKVVQKLMPVQQIRALRRIKSTAIDKIHGWIRDNQELLAEIPASEFLLHFEDDLFGQLQCSCETLIRENFSSNMRAWKNLKIVETSTGKNLHIGELPSTEREIDISPPFEAALRTLRLEKKVSATELQNVAPVLRKLGSMQALQARFSETRLDNFEIDSEKLTILHQEVLNLESVKKMLAEARAAEVDKAAGEVEKARKEKDKIEHQEQIIKVRVAEKEKELGESKESMEKLIRDMMAKAQKEGRAAAIKAMFNKGYQEELPPLSAKKTIRNLFLGNRGKKEKED